MSEFKDMSELRGLLSLRGKVKNIVIFIADSLRFDYYPKELEDYGLVVKCIAQSIFTPVSLASIVTGLNPPRHMVKDFSVSIPSTIPTMFDLPVNVSYWDHPYDLLYRVLRRPPRIPLEKLQEPFIYVERREETHVPYDPNYKDKPSGYREYVKIVRRNKSKLISDYKKAVGRAFNIFLDRLNVLKRRGILNRTLVIFLSDHGEILTEHGGLLFHNFPPCPETVYVPLAMVHPDVERGLVKNIVVRHVDVFPTITQVLGLELPVLTEGLSIIDILSKGVGVYGFNWYRRCRFKITTYSIWDKDGNGVVVIESPLYLRLASALGDTIRYTHTLHPLKFHKRVTVYGDGINKWKEVIKIFRSIPTYGIKNNLMLSPINAAWVRERTRMKLLSRIRRVKESLKSSKD